jgi:UDP-glucose 4-epimerase
MTDLSGRSALVTGATGFVGAALVRRLREAGAAVHCVSRRHQPAAGPWVRWWQADLTEAADVRRLFAAARPDLVFHLAGLTSASRDLPGVLPILHANLVATVNILVAAAEYPVRRLLLTGSLEEPLPDGTWPVASSPYAASKLAAGMYMRMCHALYGAPAVCLRVFMVYGPQQSDVRKLVPHVTCSLLRGEVPAVSSGRRPVDWIYVDDVADAFLAAAVAEGVEGETLDVGSGCLVTVREVAERLSRIVDSGIRPSYGSMPDRPLEQTCVADVERTDARLGFRAGTSLDAGLRKTVEWYRRVVAPAADGRLHLQSAGG